MAVAYDKVIRAMQSYSATFLDKDEGEIIEDEY